jgi:hypothetical protein
MEFDLSTGLEVLQRTPTTLRQMLQGLSSAWINANEGPETWSPSDVVGHLLQGDESDWVTRAQSIMEQGEANISKPKDLLAQFERIRSLSLDELLDCFEAVRSKNLAIVRSWNLSEEQMKLRGTHPDLGAVTLSQLFSTWVVHDLGHMVQITRVMAKQYGEATGPWKQYLGILAR